jgi:hypothetical protein
MFDEINPVPNGWWFMPPEPVSADDPEEPWWEDEEDWEEEYDYAEVLADCREAAEDRAHAARAAARAGTTAALAAIAATTGRRGPGQPGSEQIFPGEYPGPAALFASGMLFDTMPGGPELARFADQASDGFEKVSDDELLGIICAWDRVRAHAGARMYVAVAELIRRRPAAGWPVDKTTGMPQVWDEFTPTELCAVLAGSKGDASGLLGLAHDLEAKLPGTKAAFLDGILSEEKVAIIARATAVLTPEEARAAEALVLDRAARLTPGALRAAIARAVIEVAPDKAKERRERAARQARVERWAEESGNAGLAGRELPAAQVHAADQRISSWARQLKLAGLDGSTDELRARALMDLLLGTDSRPRPGGSGADDASPGPIPPGFVGHINLTIPLTTTLNLAERPGEIPGIGPIDPDLARDLAAAASRNPRTTWCVTVTDQHGHAIGHGCARSEARSQRQRAGPGPPGFAFTPASRDGPPDGYGTWRLRTPGDGPDLRVTLDPLTTQDCDHRYQARGHDPGVKLRHLTQIRYATCTGIACRRPSTHADFEHNTPYEAGGRTCLCNGGPKCRQDHRLKQHPRWKVNQLPDGTFRWTTPSGRICTTEPTRYPI